MLYPYSDDYMTYDYDAHRYILTEQDIFDNFAINLTERFKNENTIRTVLNQVSIQTYRYIHEHNMNTDLQNYIIAKSPKAREIIKSAMEQQLLYWLTVGDLSRSPDRNKRELWFDDTAKEILLQTIPEIGTSICFTGELRYCSLDHTRW